MNHYAKVEAIGEVISLGQLGLEDGLICQVLGHLAG